MIPWWALAIDPFVVNVLVRFGAKLSGPDANYKFTAGLRKVQMECPPTFVAAAKGDKKMVQELLRCKADVRQMAILDGEEDAISLLWSASYHGHGRTVREILHQLGPNTAEAINFPSQHQDNASLTSSGSGEWWTRVEKAREVQAASP